MGSFLSSFWQQQPAFQSCFHVNHFQGRKEVGRDERGVWITMYQDLGISPSMKKKKTKQVANKENDKRGGKLEWSYGDELKSVVL